MLKPSASLQLLKEIYTHAHEKQRHGESSMSTEDQINLYIMMKKNSNYQGQVINILLQLVRTSRICHLKNS